MESRRSKECGTCGPFADELTMVEFEDTDGDKHVMCVDCLMGVFTAIDMPAAALDAFAETWASIVLGTSVTAVTDDDPH